jgi:hypothetical protein
MAMDRSAVFIVPIRARPAGTVMNALPPTV